MTSLKAYRVLFYWRRYQLRFVRIPVAHELFTSMSVCVRVCVCVYVYVFVGVCGCVSASGWVCMWVYVHACMCGYVCRKITSQVVKINIRNYHNLSPEKKFQNGRCFMWQNYTWNKMLFLCVFERYYKWRIFITTKLWMKKNNQMQRTFLFWKDNITYMYINSPW